MHANFHTHTYAVGWGDKGRKEREKRERLDHETRILRFFLNSVWVTSNYQNKDEAM